MILKICKYGDKVLRTKTTPIAAVTDEMRELADSMLETMYKANGVGLAAQQVGRLERICVIDIPKDCDKDDAAFFNAPIQMPLRMFNPEILSVEGSERDKEGCLSFPGIGGSIVRAAQVTCRYLDDSGNAQTITARGYLARAIQHEVDHLEGILYIDHMTAVERLEYAAKLKKLAKANGGTR